MVNFQDDMLKFKDKFQDKQYALGAYQSLCNVEWVHKSAPENWQELVKKEELAAQKQRNVFYRKWPQKTIRYLRRQILNHIEYTEVEKTNFNGKELNLKVLKCKKGWLNKVHSWLLNLEFKFIPRYNFSVKDWLYSCSWRYAGELVSIIRNAGEDYLDFYCSGNEGDIYTVFADDMESIGWTAISLQEK